eukprot:comp22253_c0_seq1/m.52894 comp22253_c0_seq1/g.52894  ORF comp22253_c0_seq1/g.52894 comp22253_c0_seq1/m.52894 type:complete len:759 (-) comp22253_c0_seq1:39-2315(-)
MGRNGGDDDEEQIMYSKASTIRPASSSKSRHNPMTENNTVVKHANDPSLDPRNKYRNMAPSMKTFALKKENRVYDGTKGALAGKKNQYDVKGLISGICRIGMSASGLAQKDLFDRTDGFVVLSVENDHRDGWDYVYRSEVVWDTNNPDWAAVDIESFDLCKNEADRMLRVELYDYDSDSELNYLGFFTVAVVDLLESKQREFPIRNPAVKATDRTPHQGLFNFREFTLLSHKHHRPLAQNVLAQWPRRGNMAKKDGYGNYVFTVTTDATDALGRPRERWMPYMDPNWKPRTGEPSRHYRRTDSHFAETFGAGFNYGTEVTVTTMTEIAALRHEAEAKRRDLANEFASIMRDSRKARQMVSPHDSSADHDHTSASSRADSVSSWTPKSSYTLSERLSSTSRTASGAVGSGSHAAEKRKKKAALKAAQRAARGKKVRHPEKVVSQPWHGTKEDAKKLIKQVPISREAELPQDYRPVNFRDSKWFDSMNQRREAFLQRSRKPVRMKRPVWLDEPNERRLWYLKNSDKFDPMRDESRLVDSDSWEAVKKRARETLDDKDGGKSKDGGRGAQRANSLGRADSASGKSNEKTSMMYSNYATRRREESMRRHEEWKKSGGDKATFALTNPSRITDKDNNSDEDRKIMEARGRRPAPKKISVEKDKDGRPTTDKAKDTIKTRMPARSRDELRRATSDVSGSETRSKPSRSNSRVGSAASASASTGSTAGSRKNPYGAFSLKDRDRKLKVFSTARPARTADRSGKKK